MGRYTQDRSKQQRTTGFENQTDTEILFHRKLAATRSLNQQGPLPAKTQTTESKQETIS